MVLDWVNSPCLSVINTWCMLAKHYGAVWRQCTWACDMREKSKHLGQKDEKCVLCTKSEIHEDKYPWRPKAESTFKGVSSCGLRLMTWHFWVYVNTANEHSPLKWPTSKSYSHHLFRGIWVHLLCSFWLMLWCTWFVQYMWEPPRFSNIILLVKIVQNQRSSLYFLLVQLKEMHHENCFNYICDLYCHIFSWFTNIENLLLNHKLSNTYC